MSDCVAANLASYRDSLAGPFPHSDHNGCIPHTGSHVGEHLETPNVDEFMNLYNTCVGTSNYAKVIFAEVTGYVARRKSATRWFSTFDVQEHSLLPNALNGKLLAWADKMLSEGVCMNTAPKIRKFLLNPTKVNLFQVELAVLVHAGKGLKARTTKLEGDSFEFIVGYDTIMHMGLAIKQPISVELRKTLKQLADSHGAAPAPAFEAAAAPAAAPEPSPAPAQSAQKILESLPQSVLKTVNVSVDASFWEWAEGPAPQPRFKGKPTSWFNREKTEIRIAWEQGRDDDGNPQLDEQGKPAVEPTARALVQKLVAHGLRLEAFDNGDPPPTINGPAEPAPAAADDTPAETDEAPVSDTHLLAKADFKDIRYLMAVARTVVAPAAKYFEISMEGKRGAQLERMKAVRFFNPLHVLASGVVTETDIDGLSVLRLHKHPKIAPAIEVSPALPLPFPSMHICCMPHHPPPCCAQKMKEEIDKYNVAVKAIKPSVERRDAKGNDSFNLGDFWRANEAELPAFAFVLRAVLANAPNSIPPERVFSILNNTFASDQDRSRADYIELALQLQFNKRSRAHHDG